MNKGDTIRFKDGVEGRITAIGLGDFLGDPRPVTVQCIVGGRVEHRTVMSNELRERDSTEGGGGE